MTRRRVGKQWTGLMSLFDGIDLISGVVLFAAAVCGGAVNAVAGGGTLLTFPTLLWASQPEIIANATSTVALWPGALSSFWTYRSELKGNWRQIGLLALPSFAGGVLGAVLLLDTSNATFAALVPYLLLLATGLFMVQRPLSAWLQRRQANASGATSELAEGKVDGGPEPHTTWRRWIGVALFQFLVGVYGGYFGAGIGILMLAAFGYLGFRNIHQMNAIKNLNAMCINGIAGALFITQSLVDWRLAALMATGAVVGGVAGAGTARRIGQDRVRRIIIFIGLALSAWLLVRQFGLLGRL